MLVDPESGCIVLYSMQITNDPAVYSLYKQILDLRHDERD